MKFRKMDEIPKIYKTLPAVVTERVLCVYRFFQIHFKLIGKLNVIFHTSRAALSASILE